MRAARRRNIFMGYVSRSLMDFCEASRRGLVAGVINGMGYILEFSKMISVRINDYFRSFLDFLFFKLHVFHS